MLRQDDDRDELWVLVATTSKLDCAAAGTETIIFRKNIKEADMCGPSDKSDDWHQHQFPAM